MKRSILRIFLLALTALALLAPTALAEQWPVGVWELTDMKHGNSLISSINMQTKIVLYADGTATLTEIMTSTGKWTASGTKLTILFGDSRLKRSFEYQEDGRLLEIKEIYGFGNVSNLAYYYYTRTGDVPAKPTKVNFYEDGPLTLSIGDTLTLGFYFEPGNADSTVKWSTSKYNVVWVDQKGVVTAYNEGTATITVKTDNGKKDTIKIKVVDPYKPTKVELDKSGTVTLNMGDTLQLNTAFQPETAKTTLKWTTSSKKVATVDENGVVTPVKEGTATITVKTANGKKDTVKVKVVDPYKPSKIVLDKSGTVTLSMGETLTLGYTLSPETAKTTAKWTTSSKKVATVDENGVVTPVKEGTATITVKTHNGKKDTVKVKVVDPFKATAIKAASKLTLTEGDTVSPEYTLVPATATSTVKATSSNKKVLKVNADGTVTALKKGSATLTLKTSSGKSCKIKVTVQAKPAKPSVVWDEETLAIITELSTASAAGQDKIVYNELRKFVQNGQWNLVAAALSKNLITEEMHYALCEANNEYYKRFGQHSFDKENKPTTSPTVPLEQIHLLIAAGNYAQIAEMRAAGLISEEMDAYLTETLGKEYWKEPSKPNKEDKPSTGEYPMAELYKMCEIAIVEYEEKGSYETWEQIANAIADGRITREQTAILAETYGFRFTDRMDELGVPY